MQRKELGKDTTAIIVGDEDMLELKFLVYKYGLDLVIRTLMWLATERYESPPHKDQH